MDLAKESVYWIFRIMIVTIAITIVILILGSISSYKIDADETQSYILKNKIILDENCLAYYDYRVHLGTIDKRKFSKSHLQDCISESTGVRLNLTYEIYSEEILINDNLADKIDFCYDEETFYCDREIYFLILNDGSKEIPSTLTIDTIKLK